MFQIYFSFLINLELFFLFMQCLILCLHRSFDSRVWYNIPKRNIISYLFKKLDIFDKRLITNLFIDKCFYRSSGMRWWSSLYFRRFFIELWKLFPQDFFRGKYFCSIGQSGVIKPFRFNLQTIGNSVFMVVRYDGCMLGWYIYDLGHHLIVVFVKKCFRGKKPIFGKLL